MIVRYAPNCGVTYLAKARIIYYNSRIVIHSFKVLATVITIVNYNHKTFIVQTTGEYTYISMANLQVMLMVLLERR